MTDIVATIQYDDAVTIVQADKSISVPMVGIQGLGARDINIEDIKNVDATSLTNGSILVYKTNTNKWTSTTTLEAQNVEAGEF